MNAADDHHLDHAPFRHAEFSTAVITLGVAALLPLSIGLVTEIATHLLLPLTLLLAVFILTTHTVAIHLDDQQLEVRLGNGILRQRIEIDAITRVEVSETGRTWGLGLPLSGGRTFGHGAHSRLRIEHRGGVTEIGLTAASEVAAELRRRKSALARHEEMDS